MLPLCISVTDFRLLARAYSIALRTSRLLQVSEIGLMPTPESGRTRLPSSRERKLNQLQGLRRALGPLDARIDILGVLAKDDDIHTLGMLHRRGCSCVVFHGPHAGVEVQHLAQCDVQATEAPPTGVVSGP